GNEHVWKGIADTIGLTPAAGRGASDGYSTTANLNVNDPLNFVAAHLGQPGTRGPWDMDQVKASESLNTGSGSSGRRLAVVKASPSPLNSRSSKQGPTPEMVNAYYSVMLYLAGDLNSGVLGPYSNKSQNDCGLITSFLQAGSTAAANRGFWAI